MEQGRHWCLLIGYGQADRLLSAVPIVVLGNDGEVINLLCLVIGVVDQRDIASLPFNCECCIIINGFELVAYL